MARTTHIPTSITVSDPKWGTVVWTPSPHGQKDLRKVPEEELPQAIEAIQVALEHHLKGVNRAICDAVGHKAKQRAKALVDLETSEVLVTGGLSDRDDPQGPFQHGMGV
jgi:hypothetical protein